MASATGRIKLSFPEMAEKGGGTFCSTFENPSGHHVERVIGRWSHSSWKKYCIKGLINEPGNLDWGQTLKSIEKE